MREFGRDDHIECAVAVDVGDGCILGRGGIGTLGERHVVPAFGIRAAEGDAHVPLGRTGVLGVGLVHGNDVLDAVAVQIAHHQAVATGERDATQRRVVDQVLVPTDELPIGGLRRRGRIPDRQWGCGCAETGYRHERQSAYAPPRYADVLVRK